MHGRETYTTRRAAARLFYESEASVIAMITPAQLRGIRLPEYKSRWQRGISLACAQAARQREGALSAKQLYLDLLD